MSSSSDDDSHMIVKEEDVGDDMDLWESQPRRSAFSPYRVGHEGKFLAFPCDYLSIYCICEFIYLLTYLLIFCIMYFKIKEGCRLGYFDLLCNTFCQFLFFILLIYIVGYLLLIL